VEVFQNLIFGFSVALSMQNLFYCFVGCFVGTLIGVLPGIGPMATIAMLLPLTYNVSPVAALIMLAGIFYGAQYGGSTTSILVNLPGETSSVVTCIDGYQMARQGRAGVALSISAIGSFLAGTVCTLIVAVFGPPLAEFALKFGSPEYCSLMTMRYLPRGAWRSRSPWWWWACCSALWEPTSIPAQSASVLAFLSWATAST
jgi:putative tricarboxylic transport membrane protein